MRFKEISLFTRDVPRLAAFYARLAGVEAAGDEVHAEIVASGFTLSIHARRIAVEELRLDFADGNDEGGGRVAIGFTVADVDAEYERLAGLGVRLVNEPSTRPWGWRSFHFRDPDGNLVSFSCPP